MCEREFYLNRLKEVDREKWPEIWGKLLAYDWPDELGARPKDEDAGEVIRALRNRIERDRSLKALWRDCSTARGDFTRKGFEDWWNSQGAWWVYGSSAEKHLKSLIVEAVSKTGLLKEEAKERREKCAKERPDNRGEKLRDAILSFLPCVLGSFFGMLLARLLLQFLG